ncbi:cathelicidin-related peptide Oh-Cath [Zootoca vivipara]|uniref:cathelicidin-related peptide Oh-Cath n=1 Tax=Zootoca vivipara TaxID=8524 RepID=UPI00293B9727|nr:cathelicidin-related peptide Oh-Cath [Zootoca vivipara]
MMSCLWKVLVILGFSAAAVALAPQRVVLSYEEAVSLTAELYSQKAGVAFAFRLLEAKPQPDWDPRSEDPQKLEFTVKETTCSAAELLTVADCDFKEDGVVKECSGTFSNQQQAPVQLSCDPVGQKERIRARRGAVRDFIMKFMNKFRKHRPGSLSLFSDTQEVGVDVLGEKLGTVPPKGGEEEEEFVF